MAKKYKCKGEGCPAYQLNNEHVTFCRVANKAPVDLGDVCLNPDFAYHAQSLPKGKEPDIGTVIATRNMFDNIAKGYHKL